MAGGYSATFTVVDNATKQIDAINRRLAAMRAPMERMAKTTQRFMDVSGLRKVADGFSWIGRAASSVLTTLTAIVPVLGTLVGAATITGMVKLVSSFAAWSRELAISADEIGTTTQKLQQMQDATTLAGGSAEDMTNSLKGLTESSRNALLYGGDALGYFQRANISLRDAAGNLRSADDLLPQVIDYLKSIPGQADRAAAAQAMLGSSGLKLVETLRTQGLSFDELMRKAGKFTEMTKEQTDALARWRSAQAETEVAFTHLGQQISATLAAHFSPLLEQLNAFVEKHTPDIIQAVDRIATKFATWLDHVDWTKVEAGAESLLHVLETLVSNLDKIAEVAGIVAGLFVVKWGVQAVAGVVKLAEAIGSASGAAAGGVGLAGALAAVAAIAGTIYGFKLGYDYLTKPPGPGETPYFNPRTAEGRAARSDYAASHPEGAPAAPQMPYFNTRTAEGRAARAAWLARPAMAELPGDMSWGDYGTRANNPGNLESAPWETATGKFSYTDRQTGGAHTMAVYNSMQEGVADQIRLLKRNQAQYGKTIAGALHGYAENPYVGKLGIDPSKPFDIATADPQVLASVLASQYGIEGRKGSHTVTRDQILAGIALANAPPVNLDTTGSAPNGQVSIQVTHSNPPPGATVSATAQGNGLDLAPMRTEFANLGAP